MLSNEHDPWNNPSHRHPHAQALMAAELWDCVDEDAPFGSDEGAEAYEEYRQWRVKNPRAPLVACIEWIGDESNYEDDFTFDATIIATVLGQLVDEGLIHVDAKPFARSAIARQAMGASTARQRLLSLLTAAIEAA